MNGKFSVKFLLKKLCLFFLIVLFGCKTKSTEPKSFEKDTTVILRIDTSFRTTLKEKEKDPGRARMSAPIFTLSDLSGKNHSLLDYKGRIVILDFWATWCPPCRAEIPMLIELYNKYREKGIEIIGIGIDKKETLKKFKKEMSINYTVLVDEKGTVAKMYGVRGIPTTYILDRKGRIVERHVGFMPGMERKFVETVEKLLLENY